MLEGGAHALAVAAWDAAGNRGVSSDVVVTVANVVPPTPGPPTPPLPPGPPAPPAPTPAGGADGLVGAWSFESGTGSDAFDVSGAGNHGRLHGPVWAAGRYGGGLRFDGKNDRVRVRDAGTLEVSTGLTLEAWVRPARQRGGGPVLAKQRGKGRAYALSVAPAHRRPAGYVAAKSEKHAGGPRRLPVGEWSHVAMTYDVGGILDEVRLYDRALSRSEIRHDLSTPLP